MGRWFLARLDTARHLAGIPFRIRSAVRCAAHNRAEGGDDDSAHLRGLAVDIEATNSRGRFVIVNALILAGFTRIGINAKAGFIHVDDDGSKEPEVIWIYG